MNVDKKIIRTPVNMSSQAILTENQIKFILSKNNKLSAVMNNLNKAKIDVDGTSSSTNSLPINELGKLLLNYSKEGNAKQILKLIQEGAPFISDWLGMSALHFSAMNNHSEVLELLLRSGLNKDTKTKVDRTALHLASYHGHIKIVDILLKVDSDVNARDMLRMTPLHWAVERGHSEVARLLLKYGADVDVISKFEKTPMSIAIQSGQTELLADLQEARENIKHIPQKNDQHQTETNAAVNSIIDNNDDIFDIDQQSDINVTKLKTEINGMERITENFNENISSLDMLKKLKSMMTVEDRDDTLLTSALQNGRQLVLTEGGRLALYNTKNKQTSNSLAEINKKVVQNENKKQITIKTRHLPLKPPTKNVKVYSMDAFKKMVGQNAYNLSKSPIKTGMQLTKVARFTNINEINRKKQVFNPLVPINSTNVISPSKITDSTSTNIKYEENDDDLSSIIEICPENDSDQDIEEISNNSNNSNSIVNRSMNGVINPKQQFVPSSVQKITINNRISTSSSSSHTNRSNAVQLFDIPEICRQLQELRRSHEALRKELELTRIENEEYKMRLERLECRIDETESSLS